jgi:hypothetical protein
MKIIFQDERRVIVAFPKLGDVTLSKFSGSFDHGLYKEKPWHICGQGRNFATVEECIRHCQHVVDTWDSEPPALPNRYYYHAEQTNAFQCHEALLDSCPW